MNFELKDIFDRTEWAIGKIDASSLKELDTPAYNELLQEKANYLFREGRYSIFTEMSLEVYRDHCYEEALYNLRQITNLNDEQRVKLAFFRKLKAFCFPLFCKAPLDLSAAPFGFTDACFNIMNQELRDYLFHTPHAFLAEVLCESLINTYWNDPELKDTIVMNTLSDDQFYKHLHSEKDPDKYREKLDDMIERIYTTENHLRIGQRLGLTPQAQAVYDMTDGFVCREYFFNQVDYTKEMDLWILRNWVDDTKEHREQSSQKLVEELGKCAQKYDVTFPDKSSAINYILLDLLHVPLFDEEDYQDPDGYDFPDGDVFADRI